jgi:hypothetical protein
MSAAPKCRQEPPLHAHTLWLIEHTHLRQSCCPWVGQPQALDPTPVPHQRLIANEHFLSGCFAYVTDMALAAPNRVERISLFEFVENFVYGKNEATILK